MVFEDELINYITFRQNSTDDLLNKIKDFKYREEYYKIKEYLDDFLENDESVKRFVVMPGLRGVGKTTILFQLYDYLLNEKEIDNTNILYLSMDDIVNYFNTNLLKTVDQFLSSVHKTDKIALKKKIFIFVDESHFDKKWAISGKIIYDNTKNIFLICTGSSAIDLEINADVARRSFNEAIYPSNFKDYLLLKHDITTDNSFSDMLENIIYFGKEKYVNQGVSLEEKIHKQLYSLDNYPTAEFMDFLKSYGFPFSSKLSEEESYKLTFSLINRVIEKDIPAIKAINSSRHPYMWRVLIYLALSRPGTTSNHKIADYLSISSKTVNEILDLLEKTQIIFNVKPYGTGGKIIRKPWNYYFLSSSLKSAINYKIGRYDTNNKKCLGTLAENYVASSLFKMQQTRFNLMGLFYPPEKKSCDFLLRIGLDDIVPIEVGIGKKTKSQLTRAINKYDANYGVLISNRYNSIKQHDNIIYIPLMSFGFL